MGSFVLRRLLQAVPTFLGITMLSFALIRLAPGDPVTLFVFGVPDMTPDQLAAIRHQYGLDQPVPVQYLNWLERTATGDFGQSFLYHRPVTEMIASALPNTLLLAATSLLLAVLIGVPLGALAARFRGSIVDNLVRVVGVSGHAIPGFWFGLLFILIVGVQFRLVPISGMLTIGKDPWDVGDRLLHLLGPAVTLSLAPIANYSRLMRTEVLDVLGQDYIRTARAKGLAEQLVVFGHALRNALLPMITALGTAIAFLLSGAVVIEQVFAWPGMGRMFFEAARSKDYPIVMAVVVIGGFMLLAAYLVRDLAYGVADPRVRR